MTAMQKAIADIQRAVAEDMAHFRASLSPVLDADRWRAYGAEQDRQRLAGKSVAEASEIARQYAAERVRGVTTAEAA